jgi:hypothetical protein
MLWAYHKTSTHDTRISILEQNKIHLLRSFDDTLDGGLQRSKYR